MMTLNETKSLEDHGRKLTTPMPIVHPMPFSSLSMLEASGAISFPDAPLMIDSAAIANLETVIKARRKDQAVSAKSAMAA